jgi:hypothetical protein
MSRDKYKSGVKPTQVLEQSPSPATPGSRLVSVSYRYIKVGDRYCLSQCKRDEVKAYKSCLQKLTSRTWSQVLETGGRSGTKTGLAHTNYQDSVLRKVTRPRELSQELKISAVRASEEARLFGAYGDGVYYVLWFDPHHEIVPV